MKIEDLYYEEITTAAYRELQRVGEWFNRLFGYHPVLIGGWAVFHYNPAGSGRETSTSSSPIAGSKTGR